jgi:hypothetical protein
LESRVEEPEIEEEIQNALTSLNTANFVSGKLLIERRLEEGDYTIKKLGAERISNHELTQARAIERAREIDPNAEILLERVRKTDTRRGDKVHRP